ncbi:MAG: hypothetical protein LBS60_13545 [Deltaproteobacteria bacterium]|jgi:hypothetical protein|nr:hypothetical protein [Deltaproteobacteria bacterium]
MKINVLAIALVPAIALVLAALTLMALLGSINEARATSAGLTKVSQADIDLIVLKRDIQTETPGPIPKNFKLEDGDNNLLSTFLTRLLFVLAVLVIIVIVVIAIVKNLGQVKKKEEGEAVTEDPDLAATLNQIKKTSQNIAKGGYFAEAIHELLIKSLAEFQRRKNETFAKSLTSREILAQLKLAPPMGPALGFLVSLVELSRFGSSTPGEAEYQASLGHYETILASLSGKGRAQ